MPRPLNILISGSGIAGSVFASCLLRAYPSAFITIVERAPSLRLTGASVDIRSSAVDIIKWMGVEGKIREQTTHEEGIQFIKSSGRPIATLRASGRSDIQSITSEYEIFRGGLAKIFIEPVLDKTTLLFNESIASYTHDEKSVQVKFASSGEKRSYDLLIAADGLWSKTRASMLQAAPIDQIHDEGIHVAYFTIRKDLLNGSKMAKHYNTTGGRVCFLRPDPAGYTRAHLMNVTTPDMTEMKARLNAALREGNESYMNLMEELFGDLGWLVPEVLQGMRESDDFYCSLFAQTRSPKLCDGRVVLLGDAGYATPGIGTSLAIIGGYVMAGELLRNAGDVQTAAMEYECLMRPFVKAHQGNDNAMQYLNPQSSWGIAVRDVVLGTVTGMRLDRLAMTVAAKLGMTEKKLDMPEYPWPA